jgi:hypothetical protein
MTGPGARQSHIKAFPPTVFFVICHTVGRVLY